MTTLYFSPGACSLAPHIVLEWIGAPYKEVKIAIGSDELKALNPTGAVPVLQEDDGWVLTQASAILGYLAAKHPEAGLGGQPDLRAQADLHRWSAFFTSDVHANFWPMFMPFRYTTDESEEAKKKVVDAATIVQEKQFALLDEHLAGREWILDGGRSIIDAYAFPMIRWGAKLLPGGLGKYPNIKALHDRMAADPAVQAVVEREGQK